MVMNVLEDHFGPVYKGHQIMEAAGPGQIMCVDNLDYTVP